MFANGLDRSNRPVGLIPFNLCRNLALIFDQDDSWRKLVAVAPAPAQFSSKEAEFTMSLAKLTKTGSPTVELLMALHERRVTIAQLLEMLRKAKYEQSRPFIALARYIRGTKTDCNETISCGCG